MSDWKHWLEIIIFSFLLGTLTYVGQLLQGILDGTGHVPNTWAALGSAGVIALAAGAAQVRRTMAGIKWGALFALPPAPPASSSSLEVTKP